LPLSLIPFLLLAVPLMEIATFVVVGGQIGVLPTIGLVLATAVTGTILLRIQGFGVLSRIRTTMDEGGVPGRDLVHGFMIMAAGLLLLTPGFITDSVGFLLFVPAIRNFAWSFVRSRISVSVGGRTGKNDGRASGRNRDSSTIDLDEDEYERDRPESPDGGRNRLN
jgi:UPF0716 protein FxsA